MKKLLNCVMVATSCFLCNVYSANAENISNADIIVFHNRYDGSPSERVITENGTKIDFIYRENKDQKISQVTGPYAITFISTEIPTVAANMVSAIC